MALRDELTLRLRVAMKDRDRAVAAALRTALGAIANAEAIPVPDATSSVTSTHVAGAVAGLGAAEAPRRSVTEDEQRTIVATQRAELADHAGRLAQLCRLDEADAARRAAGVLGDALDAVSP